MYDDLMDDVELEALMSELEAQDCNWDDDMSPDYWTY